MANLTPGGRGSPAIPADYDGRRSGLDAMEKKKSLCLPEIEPIFVGCPDRNLDTVNFVLPRIL
jgi:hypothetical protein